jgi:hypothetical protein
VSKQEEDEEKEHRKAISDQTKKIMEELKMQ